MVKRIKAVKLFLALGLTASLASACSSPSSDVTQDTSNNDNSAEVATGDSSQESELSPGEQANADFKDKLSGAELLSALKEGGHIIYFRHAQTEKDYADQADEIELRL